MLLYALTGFAAGVISGLGIGGGALLIPALIFLFDKSQQAAQGINLIYFIPTAIIAVITHAKKGNIQKQGMFKLILFGLIGASCGAALALWMEPTALRRIFGFFLLGMGVIEIFKKGDKHDRSNGTNSLREHEDALQNG